MSNHKSNFNATARGMFRRAVAASAMQLGVKTPAQAIAELQRGDCDKCQVFRINLARQVADYLANLDSDLRAVYAYNPDYAFGDYQSTGAKKSLSSALYLLAWTRTLKTIPTDAITGLSQAFLNARKSFLCSEASAMCLSLNLQVVSDKQVQARQGYAAMIDSLNIRPNQVWERAPNRTRNNERAIRMY